MKQSDVDGAWVRGLPSELGMFEPRLEQWEGASHGKSRGVCVVGGGWWGPGREREKQRETLCKGWVCMNV